MGCSVYLRPIYGGREGSIGTISYFTPRLNLLLLATLGFSLAERTLLTWMSMIEKQPFVTIPSLVTGSGSFLAIQVPEWEVKSQQKRRALSLY
uniref:Uncharacterized protein n=1 Tax=Utricularia reniformis TaxID=192314 RepID=A0A1Y0AZC7_9LAMI|nr:hypothetical protein AEK19_MT0215 [Utricularia reniformis]ART30493.1 hypothetical protein AEK19_MT0215 [Utricularia reniformis]